MPYFRVVLHGKGILVPVQDGVDPAIGFYCTRDVRCADAVLARQLASAQVLEEWRGDGKYARVNRGDLPALDVDDCWRLGLWQGLFARRMGYVFYASDD